jgi:Family of unknown function (DUF6194)
MTTGPGRGRGNAPAAIPALLGSASNAIMGWVTEDEIISLVSGFPGAVTVTADRSNGAPEVAWGDSFFFYDPDDVPAARRLPFATIVTKDYDGFDTLSRLDRPGIFRLNIEVGRQRFTELFGYPPAEHGTRSTGIDYTALDEVLPHPVYGGQGWISILNPGERTSEIARSLLRAAHGSAVRRYRRRRPRGEDATP